eukprot:12793564-Alexandrium_andersonii.AAC.1
MPTVNAMVRSARCAGAPSAPSSNMRVLTQSSKRLQQALVHLYNNASNQHWCISCADASSQSSPLPAPFPTDRDAGSRGREVWAKL